MKLTTEQIKHMIKEELEKVVNEELFLKPEKEKCEENFKN